LAVRVDTNRARQSAPVIPRQTAIKTRQGGEHSHFIQFYTHENCVVRKTDLNNGKKTTLRKTVKAFIEYLHSLSRKRPRLAAHIPLRVDLRLWPFMAQSRFQVTVFSSLESVRFGAIPLGYHQAVNDRFGETLHQGSPARKTFGRLYREPLSFLQLTEKQPTNAYHRSSV